MIHVMNISDACIADLYMSVCIQQSTVLGIQTADVLLCLQYVRLVLLHLDLRITASSVHNAQKTLNGALILVTSD